MRDSYQKNLMELNNKLTEMGNMIETAIANAVTALNTNDRNLAEQTIEGDYYIDSKEKEISSYCMSVLLLQQPVASDLRFVTAATKIVTDMERIGDHAADISEIVQMIEGTDYKSYLDKISLMAINSIEMLNKSIDAYIKRDLKLVEEVRKQDDIVDNLFDDVKEELSEMLRTHSDQGKCAVDLVMIAKYFERIGDHSVNIVNWTEFCQTGYYKKSKII